MAELFMMISVFFGLLLILTATDAVIEFIRSIYGKFGEVSRKS